jgi:hypothetical protein
MELMEPNELNWDALYAREAPRILRRSPAESWSLATLVAPQRPAYARKYGTPLQEMKF